MLATQFYCLMGYFRCTLHRISFPGSVLNVNFYDKYNAKHISTEFQNQVLSFVCLYLFKYQRFIDWSFFTTQVCDYMKPHHRHAYFQQPIIQKSY